MDKLRKFYSGWFIKIISIGISVLFGFFLNDSTLQNGKLANLLTYSIVFLIVFSFISWLVKKYLWILFYPQYYFRGNWEGETKYLDTSSLSPERHETKIAQDCMSVRVEPSNSITDDPDEAFTWWTLAMEITTKGDGHVGAELLYQVNRLATTKRNNSTYGREEWTVTEYREQWWFLPFLKVPCKVKGDFFQCCNPENEVFLGNIEYIRKKKRGE